MCPFWGTKLVAVGALLFVIGFELITCFFRFGLGKTSTGSTGFIGKLTGGVRIHHGYVGLLLILTRNLFPIFTLPFIGNWQHLAAIIGWGCVLSDLIHHFWVLYPIAGKHDFDLVYPRNSFPWLAELEAKWRTSPVFASIGIFATFVLCFLFLVISR